METPVFNKEFREKLHDLLVWRRDVRRFRTAPVAEDIILDCLQMACRGPSVGNSQPWRFVRVKSAEKKDQLIRAFEIENEKALGEYEGEDAALYARLKLAGLREAPVQISVFANVATAVGKGLGSRTMPEAKMYSVVSAIQILWLMLRSYDVGLGWVSILPPDKMAELLEVDESWVFIGHLCIGYPEEQTDTPELVKEGWQERLPMEKFLLER
ncbi:5,6-dimethylbenzimidazole synthase [Emcibacter nanhaiensis]|uniref:5,6-dimethylbenzimidazole synthase n=1 Tax=Emcibacter nanhaiensis TaxID=1505037 RepID=A0A501PDB0_9PROT|nr:5,6-dimethylbenzimidazole synthase [Emcibacter nanhaiensis]TPD57894.1 5,6-dimethylbenzimidazole synthase [Emcibacter nanhaiensis]